MLAGHPSSVIADHTLHDLLAGHPCLPCLPTTPFAYHASQPPLPVVNITVSEAEELHVVHHIQPVPQRLQLNKEHIH